MKIIRQRMGLILTNRLSGGQQLARLRTNVRYESGSVGGTADMVSRLRRAWNLSALFAVLIVAVSPCAAETYPSRPISIIVPYVAGGSTDIIIRMFADKLREQLGQPVVIVNRPGAQGAIGFESARRAVPDGYTLVGTVNALPSLPFLVKNFDVDTVNDYTHIAVIGAAPLIAVIGGKSPARDLKSFLDYVRANPGKLNYAAHGGSLNLDIGMLVKMAGLDMVEVPFRGGAPATAATIADEVQLILLSMFFAKPYIEAGQLRAIGIATDITHPGVGDLPFIGKTEVPGYRASSTWFGLSGPPGMPEDVEKTLVKAAAAIAESADMKRKLDEFGIIPIEGGQARYKQMIEIDTAHFRRAAAMTGIQPQ